MPNAASSDAMLPYKLRFAVKGSCAISADGARAIGGVACLFCFRFRGQGKLRAPPDRLPLKSFYASDGTGRGWRKEKLR